MIDAEVLQLAAEAVTKLDAGAALADLAPEEAAAVEAAMRHAFDNEWAYRRLAP